MHALRLIVVAGFASTVLACGQKGPLVLPDAQHPHKKIGDFKQPLPATSTPPSSAPPTPPPSGSEH